MWQGMDYAAIRPMHIYVRTHTYTRTHTHTSPIQWIKTEQNKETKQIFQGVEVHEIFFLFYFIKEVAYTMKNFEIS